MIHFLKLFSVYKKKNQIHIYQKQQSENDWHGLKLMNLSSKKLLNTHTFHLKREKTTKTGDYRRVLVANLGVCDGLGRLRLSLSLDQISQLSRKPATSTPDLNQSHHCWSRKWFSTTLCKLKITFLRTKHKMEVSSPVKCLQLKNNNVFDPRLLSRITELRVWSNVHHATSGGNLFQPPENEQQQETTETNESQHNRGAAVAFFKLLLALFNRHKQVGVCPIRLIH